MNTVLRAAASLLAASVLVPDLAAGAQTPRKTGTIFKYEVDGLVNVLRKTAGLNAPLGGDSVEVNGKILTAMGHCHRRYYRGDGPVVRPTIEFLLRSRQAEGSFGDRTATTWAIDALEIMDKEAFAEEIAIAREWLATQKGEPVADFAHRKSEVLSMATDLWPQTIGEGAAKRAKAYETDPAALDRVAAAECLLELVVCQAANRALDRQGEAAVQRAQTFTAAQQKGFDFLMKQQQDGVFSASFGGKTFPDPGLTGLGLLALQTKPKHKRTAEEQRVIEAGLRWLLKGQNEDGTFGQQVPNYTTCVAVAALQRWDDPAVGPALERAQKAILAFQNIEQTGYQRSDRDYGSIGYGNSQRGDLSNLHFSLEALKQTGLPEDHEAFAKAIVFLQRTQNLKSVNDFKGKVPDPDREGELIDAVPGNDGGASYYPGNSAAGYIVNPDGTAIPRSYGSMTYALLKAYTLAGLSRDDPRIQAAVGWIQKNWDLATNPGADPALGEKVKYQGLYYYYMVLAQALNTAGIDTVEAPLGTADDGSEVIEEIDWRQALREKLEGLQQDNGAWVNGKNDRWMEGLDMLCTAYAMAALELCN